MNDAQGNYEMRTRRRTECLKEAVVASFCKPAAEVAEGLAEFSLSDWQRVLFWLDASGLALYLLDRLRSLGLQHCLPQPVLARLCQNLHDNQERTAALFSEAVAVSSALRQKHIPCALLKGITLSPESVPDSTLRCQLDLDILVAEKDAIAAQQVVMDLGYRLHAVSGNTLEFKAGMSGDPDIGNLYKLRPQRSLELHLLSGAAKSWGHTQQDQLTRARPRSIRGTMLPSLSPADLFLQQALHLFKHLCSEHTRASWVLEFWRHVLARRVDIAFWREVESLAANEEQASVAIGAATLLATNVFGEFAPEELSRWTMNRLSPAVRLWIETYGRRTLLADFPGSKLYLLLRSHLRSDSDAAQASLRRLVFPTRLPARITQGEAGERLVSRLKRAQIEVRFLLFRLRFHVVEGVRYAIESSRWQRRLAGMTQ
jgi:hypothetical protein